MRELTPSSGFTQRLRPIFCPASPSLPSLLWLTAKVWFRTVMGDSLHAPSLASTLGVGSQNSYLDLHLPLQCLLCNKSLARSQELDPPGERSGSPHPAIFRDLPKLNILTLEGFSKVPSSSHCSNSVSASDYKSLLENMEDQIRLIRAENSEMKREIARMYTLVQATISEIRNNNNLMNGRVSNLSGAMDYVATSISNLDSKTEDNNRNINANLDSKTEDNNRNIGDVEGKIDRLREDICHCIPGLHDNKGSGVGIQHDQSLESVPGPSVQHLR